LTAACKRDPLGDEFQIARRNEPAGTRLKPNADNLLAGIAIEHCG
jgi:hypothetical protein